MHRFHIFIIILFISTCGVGIAYSQTNVSGLISSNTVWNLAGSPYTVTGNILVDDNISLTIESGVEVLFDPGKLIQVRGSLTAVGTETNKILFTSSSGSPIPGSWTGIGFVDQSLNYNFSNNTGNVFRNCIFEYADTPIDLIQCSAFIDSCIFRHNSGLIINVHYGDYNTSNKLEISNNIFYNNFYDIIYINGTYSEIYVHHNLICFNDHLAGTAILLASYSPGFSKVYNNVIASNVIRPLGSIYKYAFYKNSVVRNEHQIGVISGDSVFNLNLITQNYSYNTISNNFALASAGASMHNNNIFNNTASQQNYAVVNLQSYQSPDIDAINNWFGTADTNTINNLVFDWFDDPSLSLVDFLPFLSGPNTDAPISPPLNARKIQLPSGDIVLKWDSIAESDLVGYKLHYGGFNDYYFDSVMDLGNVNHFIISGINLSDTLAVTTYDSDTTGINDLLEGHESWFSNFADTSYSCFTYFELVPDSIPLHYLVYNYNSGGNNLSYMWDWGDGSPIDTVPFPSHIYSTPGMYQICVTISDTSGCVDVFCSNENIIRTQFPMLFVNVLSGYNPLSLNEIPISELQIYPNPVQNKITLSVPNEFVNSNCLFYDVIGRKVKEIEIQSRHDVISVADLPNGIYVVEIRSEKGVARNKIIKN